MNIHPAGRALATLLFACACGRDTPVVHAPPPASRAEVEPAQPGRSPAVLFASNDGLGSLDPGYLRELHARGFELDYTDRLAELDPERLRAFNAVVLWTTPDSDEVRRGRPTDPARVAKFVELIGDYVRAGGGVLLMPGETNLRKQQLAELYERWGASIPAERIVETDPTLLASLSNASYTVPLALTSSIAPDPITQGVKNVWYPLGQAFLGAMTMPLVVDDNWRVLVRAAPSAHTQAIDLGQSRDVAPNLTQRSTSERAPALFAVRSVEAGRAALVAQWPQFSIGSGTKVLYGRSVLDRGSSGIPSDFGRLLDNVMRWLAEPSLRRGSFGGWSTRRQRLEYPPHSEETKASFRAEPRSYDASALTHAKPRPNVRIYQGLIGARTAGGGARTSVAEYARAARRAKLDFVIFLEPFEALSSDHFRAVVEECKRLSDAELLLLPGLSIRNNLGNRMFLFARDAALPPPALLGGPAHEVLQIQREERGRFSGYATDYSDWLLRTYGYAVGGQVGYYDFGHAPQGVRMQDARLYGAAGVRFYREGRLIEDVASDYLLTAAGTMAPAPFAIHEVSSPASLARAAKAQRGLTYVVATSLDPASGTGVLHAGLRWSTQYEPMYVFISSGPRILGWPSTHRTFVYGGEGFSPERSLLEAGLAISASAGLAELSIYDGTRLFRRIALHGATEYEQTFLLDGSLQRNLVLVVRDRLGGTALSFAHRSWSEGSPAPVFCGDRVNDCGRMRLARGPWSLPLSEAPATPWFEAGNTWDGGPVASVSALGGQSTLPVLKLDDGSSFSTERMPSVPVLEMTDEEAVAVQSVRAGLYAPTLLRVVNPWHTLGPIGSRSAALTNTQRYRAWQQPTFGAIPLAFAGHGLRRGVISSLFSDVLKFERATRVQSIELAAFQRAAAASLFVSERADDPGVVYPRGAPTETESRVAPGGAFAVFGDAPLNSHIFVNRGAELRLRAGARVELVADLPPRSFRAGDVYRFELAGHGFPAGSMRSGEAVRAYLAYLEAPTGLQIQRGGRAPSAGLLEIAVAEGAAELSAVQVPGPRTLPVRLAGLNARWSAGLLQLEGYTPGFYGPAQGRYRSLAVDEDGMAYFPLHVELASPHVRAGHPVVADMRGTELFIQVTCLGGAPMQWHVSINNPTTRSITATLRQAMTVPGLEFAARTIELAPGEFRVLQ